MKKAFCLLLTMAALVSIPVIGVSAKTTNTANIGYRHQAEFPWIFTDYATACTSCFTVYNSGKGKGIAEVRADKSGQNQTCKTSTDSHLKAGEQVNCQLKKNTDSFTINCIYNSNGVFYRGCITWSDTWTEGSGYATK